MNNFEYQKELNKKKASISIVTLVLGLSTPTLFSICKQASLPIPVQVALYLGLLIAVGVCLIQKNQISQKLERIKSEVPRRD
jgi:hypothetical protein